MSVKCEKKRGWLGPVLDVMKGGVLAVAVSVGALALASVVMLLGVLGPWAENGCVIVACVLGSVVGGRFAIGRCGRGKLLVGVGVSAMALALLLVLGLICFGRVTGVGEMRDVALGCFVGGVMAGVLSAICSEKRRGRK